MSREMKIDLGSIDGMLNDERVRECNSVLETAIAEFVKIINLQTKSGLTHDISTLEDFGAVKNINDYACNLTEKIENKIAKANLDSLRHAFASFALSGLHQLFTRQENEGWYPKIILDEALMPNDIDILPEKITLYRGTDLAEFKMKSYGQSWTTCLKIAQLFCSDHYAGQPWFMLNERVVLKTIFLRQHVYYSNQSCEFEVVIDVDEIGVVERCT